MTPAMSNDIKMGDTVVISISAVKCEHCFAPYAVVMGNMTYQGVTHFKGIGSFLIFEFVQPFRCPTCLEFIDLIGVHKDAEVTDGREVDSSTGVSPI